MRVVARNAAMKRIPREIDGLIWQLTEEGTPAALDQFRARYPDYSAVLDQRLDMVKRLKKSVPAAKPEARPRFRPQARVVEREFRWSVPVVLLAFGAIAVAAYTAISSNSQSAKTIQATPKVAPKPLAQGFVPPAEPVVTKETSPPAAPVKEKPAADPEQEIPAYLQPQTLAIRGAKLSSVLRAVAGQGKFGITIGPGMADPTITVDYRGQNSIEILEDLGRQYAFTPFDQGDGSVVIIPARDPNEKVNDSAGSKTSPSGTPEDGSVSIQPHKIETKSGETR